MARGRRWVEAVGGVVEDEGDDAGVEVSPLVSYVRVLIQPYL
jgi:UDP-N-acetylglucosamine/UDP-N-acetylgalactosamine diphosphorylase